MENLTKVQVTAFKELFYIANRHKNGYVTEDELHTAVKYIALALADETWNDGRQTVQYALQIAGIFTADNELRDVYKKMFDDVFEY